MLNAYVQLTQAFGFLGSDLENSRALSNHKGAAKVDLKLTFGFLQPWNETRMGLKASGIQSSLLSLIRAVINVPLSL